ncbi:Cytokine receptor common subunit beta [Fukomys damarensis]|uniref:Cytokine receptor common subunit beta n=1 Tax=Fukomys damarensis TaxID=885580 RepID=A0A091EMB3_FUKDA|nr:Cytokine receptor common subunit beta [Fukomys damarensis]
MALLPGPLLVALLALCWGPSVEGSQGTVPLQTLRCYNDYTSRLVCSWADTETAGQLINVTLHRRLKGEDASVIVGILQPPPPRDVQIYATGDQFWLTWSVALGGPKMSWLSQEDLEFEVVYKRLHESWEDATTVQSNSSQVSLGPELLLPSSTYVARVRTRLAPDSDFSGRPSQWSPEVQWDSQPGDEAQPQNLQCFFGFGGTHVLSCSWEVRAPVTSSVSFGLFYRSSPDAGEKECPQVQKEELGGLYIRHSCQIRVGSLRPDGQYTVAVRPQKEEMFIKSSEHIQMEAPTLNVTKDGDSYSLHWEVKKMYYSHIENTFQIQYRIDEEKWEDSKTETLKNAHSMPLPPLQPATTYWARVRVRPSPGGAYNGIWSEWSEEQAWTTAWALPTWLLAPVLVFVTLALVLALRFCVLHGYSLSKKWEERIPDPSKSHLFQSGSAGLLLPGSMKAFMGRSTPQQGPWGGLSSELDGLCTVDHRDSEVSALTTEDPKVVCDPPSGPHSTPAASDLAPECPPSTQPSPPATQGRPEDQLATFDFNGPYLGPPQSRSLPDLTGQQESPQGPKPALPSSLEYLCLPPGGQVQLIPLAQVTGQGQAAHEECLPGPGTQASPYLEAGGGPAPPASEPRGQAQDPEDSPVALPTSSGDPEHPVMASGYVTTADLALTLSTGASSVSLASPPGLQNPSLCPGLLPAGPPSAPPPEKPGFEGYVELPPTMGPPPTSPVGSPIPPAPSSPVLSPGEPWAGVSLLFPTPMASS